MNVKFHSVVFRLMVSTKCKRLQRNMMQVLLNVGFKRENFPNFLQHFSFWCSDKNGEFIENNSVGCQFIQEKLKVHVFLQIQCQ